MKRMRQMDEEKPEFERIAKKSRNSYITLLPLLGSQETLSQIQSQYEEHIKEIKQKMGEMESRIIIMERMIATFVSTYPRTQWPYSGQLTDKWKYYIS